MRHLPHIASMLYNTPLLLRADTAELFADVFMRLVDSGGAAPALEVAPPKRQSFASRHASARFADKPYIVSAGGVGVIPVYGALVQRAGQIDAQCIEMLSYERLRSVRDAMMADTDVRAVLMELDSPGGQAAGAFEEAAAIAAAGATKPIWAHANEGAYSACYALAVGASRVLSAPTGSVGSIGVIMQFVDQSVRDQKQGYKYTTIYSGKRKNDFNPHQPLNPEAAAIAKQSVDRLAGLFHELVATRRGLDVATVRDLEAGILEAPEAWAAGLIDDIATFDEALAALESEVKTSKNFYPATRMAAAQQPASRKETTMSTTEATAATTPAAAVDTGAITRDAVAAERARVSAIVGHPEAKGREDLAQSLAFETDMSPEAAARLLAKSPKASAAVVDPLSVAMAQVANPKVAAGANASDDVDSPEAIARRVISARYGKPAAAA